MNERIKQLAEQAKKYALDAMIKITDKEQALKVYSETYDTKFAELIVRECLSIVEPIEEKVEDISEDGYKTSWPTRPPIPGYDDEYVKYPGGVEITEHFGVKE